MREVKTLHLKHGASAHRGITLLELLLALALTGLIMVIISMAIDLHLRTLDLRRTNVEEAELARAVLRHIATDLRSAVLYDPIDMSGTQSLAAETDPSALLGGIESGESSGSGRSGGDDSGDSGGDFGAGELPADALGLGDLGMESGLTLNNVDIAGSTMPTSVPGLYGNQYELQVDISRLPRVDQYAVGLSSDPNAPADIPSDVKTISYFLASATGGVNDPSITGQESQTGLIRRSMDRAVTSYAAMNGGEITTAGEVLAAEVNYLEFRYFSGTEWLTEWDSEQMGGLPIAVEIAIAVDPTGGREVTEMTATELSDAMTADQAEYFYRLVVRLPVAQPPVLEEETTDPGLESLGL